MEVVLFTFFDEEIKKFISELILFVETVSKWIEDNGRSVSLNIDESGEEENSDENF